MLDTKAMIIHQILKLDKPFKPRHIYEEIGLSAQNTNNHLSRLIGKGVLTKRGSVYSVLDRERLIDELILSSDGIALEKAVDVTWIGRLGSNTQEFVDQIVRARVLEMEGATDVHMQMNHRIDEAMGELKKLKKWLNTKSYTIKRAELGYNQQVIDYLRSDTE